MDSLRDQSGGYEGAAIPAAGPVTNSNQTISADICGDGEGGGGCAGGDAEGLSPGFWKTNADNHGAVAWPRDDGLIESLKNLLDHFNNAGGGVDQQGNIQ